MAFQMTLRNKFILPILIINGVLITLLVEIRISNPVLFLSMEMLLFTNLGLTLLVCLKAFQPLELIAAGTMAVKSQDFSVKLVPVGQRETDQLIEVYNRMIDALRQERISQHEKNVLLERLIQASPAGILILDFDGRVESVNASAEKFLSHPAATLLGKAPADLPEPWGTALASVTEDLPLTLRSAGLQTYRVHIAHFLDKGFIRYFLLLEELTQELIKQEKRVYEQLIRMLAHEINNSIGPINSILQSFYHYVPQLSPDDQFDYSDALDVSIARNTRLANFIDDFAHLVRLPQPVRQSTDVGALLKGIGRLLHPQSDRLHIQWHWELVEEPLILQLDARLLEQAVINIAKNALEAIGNEGHIWVRLSSHPPILVIENDGRIITPEVHQRLFTPFYSTKQDGQGIGLTLIRDILLAHGLRFELASTTNSTTAFTIWLTQTIE